MNKQQKYLIAISPVLVISMIIVCFYSTRLLGKATGYILTNILYWFAFCIPSAVYITKGNTKELIKMYQSNFPIAKKNMIIYGIVSGIPVLATCVVSFIPTIKVAPVAAILLALIYAVFNGSIEELFWRGLFNKVFNTPLFAFFYPLLMFSCWHIALAVGQGMVYTGGSLVLIGGASFMGVLWGVVAYRTKSIKYTTIAHVLTNCFAFSAMIYENWFL